MSNIPRHSVCGSEMNFEFRLEGKLEKRFETEFHEDRLLFSCPLCCTWHELTEEVVVERSKEF